MTRSPQHTKATRDPDATRARILAAGERAFAAKGIAGARVDAIAAQARSNKRMLYYYFGSKEGLFRAVLESRLAVRLADVPSEAGTRIERLVARQASHLRDRVYLRLLTWEALEGDRRRTLAGKGPRQTVYRDWVAAIEAEQAAGAIDPDLDAAQLVLTEMALTMFPAAFAQITRLVTGLAPSDPEFLRRRQQFLARYAAKAYAPTGSATPREPLARIAK